MATYSKILLSGSTSGKPIPVVATSSTGTTIHTAVAGAAAFDEIYIYATNVTASPATLTVEYGGTTDPGNHLVKNLAIPPYSGPFPIVTGQVLNGGLAVTAFGGTASAINLTGFVNRIV